MLFFIVAFGLLAHLLFWGAGLALLITPRPYRRFWPLFCAPFGLALQSAAVWAGVFAGLPGTDAYGRYALALPAALLIAGLWRGRAWLAAPRKFNGLWLAMAVCLAVLVIPLASSSKVLTTTSLGSCDAADYAAGARVFKEFARGDRSGFMGLTAVVSIASIDNFFDLWVRLNHFTPTAVIALNASVLGLRPYEIISVLAAVFLVSAMPVVFWLARSGLGLAPGVSCGITLLYGLNPLNWYADYHAALAQLLAAQAIALLTWAGVALWRSGARWRQGLVFGGCLLAADWLVLGSYNFIVLVCLIPALAYALGQAAWRGNWRQFGRWCALMALPMLICLVTFWGRTRGIGDRFQVMNTYDLGWRIPALSPEGWLGLVAGPGLAAHQVWLRVALGGALLFLLGAAWIGEFRRRSNRAWLALCLSAPILIGYAVLLIHGGGRSNAGYEAYKLFAVFFPGLLAALCLWAQPGESRRRRWREWAALGFAAVVLGLIIVADWRFERRMETPPLIVDRPLAQLYKAEALDRVDSVNMLVGDFWSRLWASAFLLRKPQYFATFTYEGHRPTALLGHWDLSEDPIKLTLPDGDSIRVNPWFSLIRVASPYFLTAAWGEGWYGLEHLPRTEMTWRWSKGNASLVVENPQTRPLTISCRMRVQSLIRRDVAVWVDGRPVLMASVGRVPGVLEVPAFAIPPGRNVIELRSSEPAVQPNSRDRRRLCLEVHRIEIRVHRDGVAPPKG